MRCLFSAGENLSDCSSHVSDQRRNGVIGCDHQFAYTLMDVAGITEPHIAQVLLTSHRRQIEHTITIFPLSVLHVARFTPTSYFTKDERSNTDTLHASSTDSADRLYVRNGYSRTSECLIVIYDCPLEVRRK